MKARLVRGRSRASWLLFAGHGVHLFVWAPFLGADSTGATLRWRRRGGWQHARLVVGQRNKADRERLRATLSRRGSAVAARRTLTVAELAFWRTAPGTGTRVGTKGYVRLKAAAQGREL